VPLVNGINLIALQRYWYQLRESNPRGSRAAATTLDTVGFQKGVITY